MVTVIRWGREAVRVTPEAVELLVPDQATAMRYVKEHCDMFARWAIEHDRPYALVKTERGKSFKIPSRLAVESGADLGDVPENSAYSPINSYAPSIITPDASYQAVMDFIMGKQAEGLIVTVMSMGSDKFLFVNGAQVSDRGGDAETWIGVDAKQLVWGRSLTGTLPGRDKGINYYARLYELLESDRHIPDWGYFVTRPNGDLYRDVSSYFFIENYLGVAARIAISRVGDSELVESAPRARQ